MNSTDGVVRVDTDGSVATLTFDRPGVRNAMSWSMWDQLEECLNRVDGDDAVRVVRMRGAGQSFISGTDIAHFSSFESAQAGVDYEARLERVIQRIEALRVPSIAMVDGTAAGGGLLIAAACDIRICTPQSRFGAPIARTVGNGLSLPNMARLVALLGPARVKAMMLLADFMGAEEALVAGLVAEVVERAGLDARALDLCERVASHAPVTLRVTREAVRRVVAADPELGVDLVREVYGSADFGEGVRAFLDKRKPRWSGH